VFSPAECPIVGHNRIAGRDAVHRHCPARRSPAGPPIASSDVWADSATDLLLKYDTRGQELRVLSIVYGPTFPPGTFRFMPPPGSISQQRLNQLGENPYYKTKLAPGKPAPDWHATALAGGRFQVTDLRGKPALLLFVPDDCSDPACDDLGALEQAYQKSNHQTQVVWVDIWFGEEGRGARKVARLNHLTFPIVLDHNEASHKAWAFGGYPFWLLLDSRGRVIEARFKPQTMAQLTTMLAEPRTPR
jgi:peroxiredoxin